MLNKLIYKIFKKRKKKEQLNDPFKPIDEMHKYPHIEISCNHNSLSDSLSAFNYAIQRSIDMSTTEQDTKYRERIMGISSIYNKTNIQKLIEANIPNNKETKKEINKHDKKYENKEWGAFSKYIEGE